MDPVLKRRLEKLIDYHGRLVPQLTDQTLSEQQRRTAQKILDQVDAMANVILAKAEVTDYEKRMAAQAATQKTARPQAQKRSKWKDWLGKAAMVWYGSSMLDAARESEFKKRCRETGKVPGKFLTGRARDEYYRDC